MHSSKLFDLLRGLRPEEIHWFQKFLHSPFFNNNTLPIRLFEHLKKNLPELDSPKLTKEKVFQKLFPNEKFNVQKLRKVMFDLKSLTEEFFITIHLRNKDFEKKKLLAEAFGERNLYPQFEKKTKELIGELEALPYRDTFFYQNIFELNYNYSNHQETNRQKLNGEILKTATEHLDGFYVLQKEQLSFGIKLHAKVFKEKVKVTTISNRKKELRKEPTLQLYELINAAISKLDNQKEYDEIEFILKNEKERLGRTDKVFTLRILLNYSSSQINRGNKEHFAKMFSLYQFGLEQNLFIENEKIGETIFTNIITVSCNVKEFEWVEKFIGEYKKYLSNSIRGSISSFGLAMLFFHKKEFEKTIDLILNANYVKPLRILQTKTLLLRAYLEKYLEDNSYYDLLIAQSLAFEKFLRRNDTISKLRKEGYLNFILWTRKIINDHFQNKLHKELYRKIEDSNSVVLKFWLLEKLNSLF